MMTSLHEGDLQPAYPFTAIVGQAELKQALLLVAVDPLIGGVLALGDRGTGKSTAVRALARSLPTIRTVAGCPFHCDPDEAAQQCSLCRGRATFDVEERVVPVVDLPLGAGEDRVTGGLDIEAALARGEKRFEPGLLGRANRGFLYIDEVNLLDDHLVDLLLDVAASGVNVVERDGVSMGIRLASCSSDRAILKKATYVRSCWTDSDCTCRSARSPTFRPTLRSYGGGTNLSGML